MNKILTGCAIAGMLAVVPALAADKDAGMDTKGASDFSEILKQEGQNREPGEDGTFQGKPVVEGPADWSHIRADTAGGSASGASSGEAGQESGAEPELEK